LDSWTENRRTGQRWQAGPRDYRLSTGPAVCRPRLHFYHQQDQSVHNSLQGGPWNPRGASFAEQAANEGQRKNTILPSPTSCVGYEVHCGPLHSLGLLRPMGTMGITNRPLSHHIAVQHSTSTRAQASDQATGHVHDSVCTILVQPGTTPASLPTTTRVNLFVVRLQCSAV